MDAGLGGEWRFVTGESNETEYVFAFTAPGKSAPAAKAAAAGKAASGSKAASVKQGSTLLAIGKTAGRQSTASEGKTRSARRKQPAGEQALHRYGVAR